MDMDDFINPSVGSQMHLKVTEVGVKVHLSGTPSDLINLAALALESVIKSLPKELQSGALPMIIARMQIAQMQGHRVSKGKREEQHAGIHKNPETPEKQ